MKLHVITERITLKKGNWRKKIYAIKSDYDLHIFHRAKCWLFCVQCIIHILDDRIVMSECPIVGKKVTGKKVMEKK